MIATLVEEAKRRGWEVVIYSADKDIMQLIGDGVTMIDALHQKTYTRDEVIKKMGVPPEQIPDFLALVGDTSDNIPGIYGVGDKTAASLLEQYGSLQGADRGEPGRAADQGQAAVRRSRAARAREDLAQARRAQARRGAAEEARRAASSPTGTCPALLALFTELEFQVLVEKVKMRMPPTDDMVVVPAPEIAPVAPVEARSDTRIVTRRGGDRGARDRDRRRPEAMAITIELDPERVERAQLVAIVIAVPGLAPAYVPVGHRYIGAPAPPPPSDLEPLLRGARGSDDREDLPRLEDRSIRTFANLGVEVDGIVDDTMLAAFLLDPTEEAEPGEAVAQRLGGVMLPSARRSRAAASTRSRASRSSARRRGPARSRTRCCRSPTQLPERLAAGGLEDALPRRSSCRSRGCSRTSSASASTSTAAHFKKLGARGRDAARASSSARSTSSPAASSTSARRSSSASCCSRSSASTTKGVRRTKTGLVDRGRDARAARASDHRADPGAPRDLEAQGHVPRRAAAAGLAEDRARAHDVQPGRRRDRADLVAGSEPPEHSDPLRARHEDPPRLHRGAGHDADRRGLLADRAAHPRAPVGRSAALGGVPRSRSTSTPRPRPRCSACRARKSRPSSAGSRRRSTTGCRTARAISGSRARSTITRTQAAEYSRRYFQRFPTIHKFMDEIVAVARAQGGARTLLGRWRPIANLMSKCPAARHAAERVAQNTPMQGTGADIIKLAMLRTTERDREARSGRCRCCSPCTTSSCSSRPPKLADEVGAALKRRDGAGLHARRAARGRHRHRRHLGRLLTPAGAERTPKAGVERAFMLPNGVRAILILVLAMGCHDASKDLEDLVKQCEECRSGDKACAEKVIDDLVTYVKAHPDPVGNEQNAAEQLRP